FRPGSARLPHPSAHPRTAAETIVGQVDQNYRPGISCHIFLATANVGSCSRPSGGHWPALHNSSVHSRSAALGMLSVSIRHEKMPAAPLLFASRTKLTGSSGFSWGAQEGGDR